MLKVNAAAKSDDDEPSLMDVKQTPRTSAKPEKRSRRPVSSEKPATKSTLSPALTKPSAVLANASSTEKKPKPKMRLLNGKLVPVDDGPKLF